LVSVMLACGSPHCPDAERRPVQPAPEKIESSTKIVIKETDICTDIRYIRSMILSPSQSRAARGLVDWSQDQLAKKAGVGNSTVRDFEKGRRVPLDDNLAAIRRALEEAGVEFIPAKSGKGVGVRLRKE
jgi:ribosome-binding protein aMBF1 (putative translation factor)